MAANYPPAVASMPLSSKWVYRELRQSPGGQLSVDELEELMACDRSTVNRAINTLEEEGFAEIVYDPAAPRDRSVALL